MTLATSRLSISLGRRTVLQDVSFALEAGQLTAVIGPNGAGKSTLLRALAGLLPPTHGDVTLDGRSLADLERGARARAIGFLPQQRLVHWPITVARTVMLGRVPHGSGAAIDVAAIERAMVEMDIVAFRHRPVTELSGGELARVLMARVLAQETPVLIADEPTAGLDPAHQLALLDRLARLAAGKRTVIVAMHDLSLAARYCARVIVLGERRLAADGAPLEILTPTLLKSVFGIDARIESIGGLPVVLPVGLC